MMNVPASRHARPLPVLVLLAFVAGCGGEPPAIERLAPDATILVFGDSLTHGTGAARDAGYGDVLERLSGREVIESGVPGELSAAGRRRLPGVLDRVQPDLLVLCHAGNDILRGRDLAAARRNLEAMIDSARDRGIPVVLVGVPSRSLFTDTADLYYAVAETKGVALEDAVMETIIDDASLRSDAVHPNAAGYRRMAQAVHRLLVRTGALDG